MTTIAEALTKEEFLFTARVYSSVALFLLIYIAVVVTMSGKPPSK